jgi:hypothetical protein
VLRGPDLFSAYQVENALDLEDLRKALRLVAQRRADEAR